MKKSIVIVDDHILIAQALKAIISNFETFEVLYECENGKELQDKFASNNPIPDIVLLDISMPIMNGFETAAWLSENYPTILIMTLSMQDDDKSVINMIKNGAQGYIVKNSSPDEFNTALLKLIKDGYSYPDWASKLVFSKMNGNSNDQNDIKFTNREKEFLKLAISEMNYKEISEIMYCSPRTVESYRDSLFEKLDLKSRVGLVIYALKNGFDI